jgi:alpha(1,3/1,4) fucosyltransferase
MILTKPSIKVNFIDFWPHFDLPNFMFYQLLNEKYNVLISDQPDILFYSVYGNKHCKYTCTKIFFTAENLRPDFNACDFAFTFDHHDNKRNYRLPLYAFYDDVTKLIKRNINARETLAKKTKFCCFVVSNPSCEIRNNFYTSFSKHKHIDSAGQLYNNMNGLVENKREFIKDYKFVIAFENSSYPGYVTEKIFEPLLENCIPIYWGNPLIGKDFNTRSFINCHDFASFEDVIKHVIEINADDEKYMQYLNEPVFSNNELNEYVKKENIISRLDQIVSYNINKTFFSRKRQKTRPMYCFFKEQTKKIKKQLLKFSQL